MSDLIEEYVPSSSKRDVKRAIGEVNGTKVELKLYSMGRFDHFLKVRSTTGEVGVDIRGNPKYFITRFFAERNFKKLVDKYNLEIEED